jgi:hypothetical protein
VDGRDKPGHDEEKSMVNHIEGDSVALRMLAGKPSSSRATAPRSGR